jgi:NADPH:quinone reductase-like Zn-dependent oxidoreductase
MADTSVPQTMRALFQPDYMSTNVILTERPVPTPKPNSTEHLIKVHTVAPCARELLWFRDFPVPDSKEPIPCYDVAPW